MIYTNKYIKENYEELNGFKEDEISKFIKAHARFIKNIQYPTQEQIEYAIQFDDWRGNILKGINHYPVEFIEKVALKQSSYLKKMKNIPKEYLDVSFKKFDKIGPKRVTNDIFKEWIKVYDDRLPFSSLHSELQTKLNLKYYILYTKYIDIENIPIELFDSEIIDMIIEENPYLISDLPKDLLVFEHYKNALLNIYKSCEKDKIIYKNRFELLSEIPQCIANKLILDNNIHYTLWPYIHLAETEVFAKRLRELHTIDALQYVPKYILDKLFDTKQLDWILDEDNIQTSTFDNYYFAQGRVGKHRLLDIDIV